MSTLALPRRASRQPVREAVLDYTNHLADGLLGGYLASTGRFFGAPAGIGARFGGTPRMVFDPKFGFGIRRSDTFGGSINQVDTGRPALTTSDVTILAVARPSTSTAAGAYLATMGQNAGAVGLSIRSGTGTEAKYQMTVYIGATRTIGGSIPVSLSRDIAVVVGRHIRNVEQALFVNGVKDPAVGNFTGSTINLSFFGITGTGPEQETYMLLVWDRALSDDEIARISADPYQIFAEPARMLAVPASAPIAQPDPLEPRGAAGIQGNQASTGSISQSQNVGGMLGVQSNAAGVGSIWQAQDLSGAPGEQANAASPGVVDQQLQLAGAEAAQQNAGSTAGIGQGLTLAGADGTQQNAGGVGVIVSEMSGTLSGDVGSQGNTGGSGAIAQVHALVGDDGDQFNVGALGAVGQAQILSGDPGMQSNTGGSGTITTDASEVLSGAASEQANLGTTGSITQTAVLAGADGVQQNTGTIGGLVRQGLAIIYIDPGEMRMHAIAGEQRLWTAPGEQRILSLH